MTVRIRTGYSFRTAVGEMDDVLSRVQEIGLTAAPITDRASTFGYVRWTKACKKLGLKPIYGVELAVSPSIEAKKPLTDYFTFIAKTSIKHVNELVGMATRQFRYEPLLNYQQLKDASGVIKIAGRRADLNLITPDEDTYVSLSPASSIAYINSALDRGFKLVAASDNMFPRDGDEGFYQVLIGRFASSGQTYSQHILDDGEFTDFMAGLGLPPSIIRRSLANRNDIFADCTATLPKGTLLKPDRPESLRAICERAAPGLEIDLSNPEYRDRLDRELSLIEEKQFEDYFYIVGDLVRWARERMVVGPARGSSCGSLVCFLLGITAIDPLRFNLLFERFIDINRNDLPDIDVDFEDTKRSMVFDYLSSKYGADRVARLGAVAKYAAASAMNETAAALKVPKWEAEPVLQAMMKRSSGDARAQEVLGDAIRHSDAGKKLLAEYPEMIIAARLEGHPRHVTQHAAGVVLTDKPISEYVALDARAGSVHCDKKDAEELDLLKIDALGVTQLSIFSDALRLAGLPHDFLDRVPIDDQKVFDILNRKEYAGIFQFNGPALQNVARMINFTELEDITAVTALARPGPLASGGTDTWIKRKSGTEPVRYPHPAFEPFIRVSYGVVIYQEQVMQIGRELGDLSWDDVTQLRKAMSKSLGAEFFNQYGDRWKTGARTRGIPDNILDKVWDDLCAYGSWAFNRSHSVAYGLVSYWCGWLKAHYPMEFAAASLNHESDPDKQIGFLRELAIEGIGYIPCHADFSGDEWRVGEIEGEKKLIGPIHMVNGIGPKMVAQVMSARARGEPIPSRAQKLLESPKTKIDSLFPLQERLKTILPDPRERNIYTPPSKIHQIQANNDRKDVLLFCRFKKINTRDENEAVKIAKRGGKMIVNEPTTSLNLTMEDDTGMMFGKIDRFKYKNIGQPIVDAGKPGKLIYAVKGKTWGDQNFRGVSIENVRLIGEME